MKFLQVMATRYKELAQDAVEAYEHGTPETGEKLEAKASVVWSNMEKVVGREAVMMEVFG